MDQKTLTYRIFYWIPNTHSGERIAIGLCLFDREADRLDTHWISQKELSRIQNIFAFSSKADSRDMLYLMHEAEGSWKSKAYDPSSWDYIERYWNGIIRVSDPQKVYYDGSKKDFENKSEALKNQFLPLSQTPATGRKGRPRSIVKKFELEAERQQIKEKISLGTEIPEHGKFHLLKSLFLDLGALNGDIIGAAGIDFSLKPDTLVDKAHTYLQGFQSIKYLKKESSFSLVTHHRGNSLDIGNMDQNEYVHIYDDFRHQCDESEIEVLNLGDLPDYLSSIAQNPNLRPLDLEEI